MQNRNGTLGRSRGSGRLGTAATASPGTRARTAVTIFSAASWSAGWPPSTFAPYASSIVARPTSPIGIMNSIYRAYSFAAPSMSPAFASIAARRRCAPRSVGAIATADHMTASAATRLPDCVSIAAPSLSASRSDRCISCISASAGSIDANASESPVIPIARRRMSALMVDSVVLTVSGCTTPNRGYRPESRIVGAAVPFSSDRAQTWQPHPAWRRVLTVESHAAGEPLRVITAGLDPIPGTTMLEKRRFARERLDGLRRGLVFEPRGHADMYGAIPTAAVTPDGDSGVLFMHNEGWSTMCGHGVIALVTVAIEVGLLTVRDVEETDLNRDGYERDHAMPA